MSHVSHYMLHVNILRLDWGFRSNRSGNTFSWLLCDIDPALMMRWLLGIRLSLLWIYVTFIWPNKVWVGAWKWPTESFLFSVHQLIPSIGCYDSVKPATWWNPTTLWKCKTKMQKNTIQSVGKQATPDMQWLSDSPCFHVRGFSMSLNVFGFIRQTLTAGHKIELWWGYGEDDLFREHDVPCD